MTGDDFPMRVLVRIVAWICIFVALSVNLNRSGFGGLVPLLAVGALGVLVVVRWWKRKLEIRRFDREWRDLNRELDKHDPMP